MSFRRNNSKKSPTKEPPSSPPGVLKNTIKKTISVRNDGLGYTPQHNHDDTKIPSLTYPTDESEAYRAYAAQTHHKYRGRFWNEGKHEMMQRYFFLACIGITQGSVAYFTNLACGTLTDYKFETAGDYLENGHTFKAFCSYFFHQLIFAAWASMFVAIEPMCGGSGIPEVKIFLNGIDLPRVNDFKTGVCKILGVIGSVSAGLPIGKEGPMVHSGAVVSTTISSGAVKNDKTRRDYVACGAASGVCTAFSAPIGGILFSLEEGASYWNPSITFRTFFCSAFSIATLYVLNTIATTYGKIGFNKLFSFGNFIYENRASSYAIWELLLFILVGAMGGLIGAVFNDTNERLTKWRMKNVNHSKLRRFLEVMCISSAVSIVGFGAPFLWNKCTPLPQFDHVLNQELDAQQIHLMEFLVPFGCPEGQFNEVASLFFNDGNTAIKLLFHMREHTFTIPALFIFFIFYISLATVTYGIAVPSGLFVPSLLSGAAFGRLFGNLIYKINPTKFAFSNIYSLIGAAAVLGGMARMTISLTVILLEATGNEQFVLPLMITLFTARVVGGLFNDDLYHIHIHLKKGVQFLDAELQSLSGHHNLLAGHIMSRDVVFSRPIEKVGTLYDLLETCDHSCFPVVDTSDKDVLYGTISRDVVSMLFSSRAFGLPSDSSIPLSKSIVQNHVELDPFSDRYVPLVPWSELQREYPKFPKIDEISISETDRELMVDLRPYVDASPFTVKETTSVRRAYEIFRSLGLRILVVVNKYNQCVGTITRDDLVPEAISKNLITKGKNL